MLRKLTLMVLLLLFPSMVLADACDTRKDWKRAIWRVPLHMMMSAPVAASSLVLPPIGRAYVNWRFRAEKRDVAEGKDSPMKASVDLYSQVSLVRGTLKLYGVQTEDDTLPPCNFSRKK